MPKIEFLTKIDDSRLQAYIRRSVLTCATRKWHTFTIKKEWHAQVKMWVKK